MWIFSSPKNYSEMVEKISKCSFVVSVLLLYILSCSNKDFANFLFKISFGIKYEFIGVRLTLAGVVLPLSIGIIEHIFKLHDKISTILKIRKRYDKSIIISSLLKQLGLEKNIVKLNDNNVAKLMSSCFYKYASSTAPVIDNHNILLALNEWCWFWIILDTEVLLLITGCAFLLIQFSWCNALYILVLVIIIAILNFLIKQQCSVYTKAEIKDILRDENRKKEIMVAIKKCIIR